MARNKEALVLLIDVGPSMHGILPEVERVCSRLVQKKLIFGKSDEVGIVLFGTEGTDNELEKEVGGYEHVVVLQKIKVVDGDVVYSLKNLPRGTANGDFLDAIVVGMDMLIKKFGETNKGKQRLCLVTNAVCAVKEPFEGTKEDQVDTISTQMKAHGMKLECIIHRGELSGIADRSIMDENDNLLSLFSRKRITKTVYVDSPTSFVGALRTRNISPATIFRGDLEFSPAMKIKVWVYKKTAEEKFPALKNFSDKAPPSDKFATHEVKVDFEYKSLEDPDKVVPPEQRIKGYRYGPQVVPISIDEWEAVKFKAEKSVKLLGFTDSTNIMRHHYMKDVNVFIPEPGNRKAVLALSAVARAMKEMNKVAILRCVWRQGQGNVVIGVLTPNVSSMNSVPDSFYFNVLPFAEDIREFQFPSFSGMPSSYQPTEKEQDAADDLVKMFDLAPPSRQESLKSDFTPNPVLECRQADKKARYPEKLIKRNLNNLVANDSTERYYEFLELKSRQADANVPSLDRSLKKIVEPDPYILSQNKSIINNFRSLFELKENPKRKKSLKRVREEMATISDRVDGTANDTSLNMVGKIGDLDPVKDFEGMLARRDGPDWVGKAIKEMENYIWNLLENSYEGDTYSKAIECFIALRKGCVLEQEPKEFNRFLVELYERWKTTDLYDFFQRLGSDNINLISKEEAVDSDVTDEEAKQFPAKVEFESQ